MEQTSPSERRHYRGMSGPERAAVRRERLMEAGLELFGTAGYVATTVEDVCREAGLIKRYFYESFADREGLFLAVYDALVKQSQEAVLLALAEAGPGIEEQSEAGLTAFVRSMGSDLRVTRVAFQEIIKVGTPAAEARYRRALRTSREFIVGILTQTTAIPPTRRVRMGATMIVGAVTELMTEELLGEQQTALDELADICNTLFRLAYQQFLRELSES